MEDINRILNHIILKYDLAIYYPQFPKMLQAEELLFDFFRTHTGRIACIATFISDIKLMRQFSRGSDRVDYFLCEKANDYEVSYDMAFDIKKLMEIDWTLYDEVLVVSLEGSSFIKRWLRMHKVNHIFLYDWFAIHGVVLNRDWNSILSDPALEWWTYYLWDKPKENYIVAEIIEEFQAYHSATDPAMKKLHLHKSYFLALCIKDFLFAARCIKLMGNESSQQVSSWQEIEKLLNEIKKQLCDIKRKDLLLLWTDAIPYEEIDSVPYLKNKMDEGVSFDNIFTICPNTNPTLKAILCGKLPVDDDSYSVETIMEENSPVYQLLKENGYEICVIGGWPAIREQDRSPYYRGGCEPVSRCLWELWRNLLLREKPTFYMVHSVLESHEPYLSAILSDSDMGDDCTRLNKSCKYLDEQYHYYMPSLSHRMTKFYMTDHGKAEYKSRFHTYLVIEREGTEPRRIKNLCSFVDFHKLLRQIVEGKNINEHELQRDYVEVQDLDLYNPVTIAKRIKKRAVIDKRFFGYHGIITLEYMYLHFTDGGEWFVKRGTDAPEPNIFDSYICDEREIERFRAIVRDKEKNMPSFEEKLKYSRYIHIIFARAKEDNLKKRILLERWLSQYPRGSVLLRTGGQDALRFYEMLSQEGKMCIGGVIDKNSQCLCASLKKPLYTSLEEVPHTFKAILLASKYLIGMLREEAAHYSNEFDILDPYQFLAEHGIICRNGAGAFEAAEENYDVDFPFDEVIY